MPINISLPNGRTVDVETKHGANYFINYGGPSSFEFFGSNLEAVDEIYDRVERRSRKNPTSKESDDLTVVYATAAALAENSDPEIFAEIPHSEIELYIDHVIEHKRTGTLVNMHEKVMVHGWMDLLTHAVPCKLAFEKNFFEVIANFVAAPSAVSADDAESIAVFVANALISAVFNKDILSSPERAFKKLESCGMLERFIGLSICVTISCQRCILKFYDELIKCPSFIEKKFAKDQPCGQMTMIMLDRPAIRYHFVIPKLKTIIALTNLSKQQAETPPSLKEGFRFCRRCNKMDQPLVFQQSLKKCSRCKSTFYCSKECQVADWKSHKKTCKPVSGNHEKQNLFVENTVLNFVRNNYVAIMKEIVKVSDETGKSKRELLIELDFATPDGFRGMAPALKNPPQFRIAESKGYFQGSRPNEPGWLKAQMHQDMGVYESNVKAITRVSKDTYNRLTNTHLLGFVRSPTRDTGCYRLQLQSPIGKHMLSEEAVDAARAALKDGDFDPFEAIMGIESAESRACMRTVRKGFGGLPSESELDAVREMLNMNFGADFRLSRDG